MRTVLPIGLVLLTVASGCAQVIGAPPRVAPGWSREELRVVRESCGRTGCRTQLEGPGGAIHVTTQTRVYPPHRIPGWENGTWGGRAVSSVVQGIVRSLGGRTDRVQVGLGTRAVSGTGADGFQLRCTLFWIDDEELEHDREDGDYVARASRRTEGTHCSAVRPPDTTGVRWRFRTGIAPPRDSLAVVYDSLAAARSNLVAPFPPMELERVRDDGVEERYDVLRDSSHVTLAQTMGAIRRLRVQRGDGTAIMVLHGVTGGGQLALDHAPEATVEEKQILRLLSAAILVRR